MITKIFEIVFGASVISMAILILIGIVVFALSKLVNVFCLVLWYGYPIFVFCFIFITCVIVCLPVICLALFVFTSGIKHLASLK